MNMIKINQIKKKQATIESVLHVETHGHTRTVTVCAQHLDIVKGV